MARPAEPKTVHPATGWSWHRTLKWARLLVPVALIVFMVFMRLFLTPDILFVMLFIVFLVYGMAFQFIVRFIPFVALLLSYDSLRGFIPYVSKHVHFSTMINFDRFAGRGTLPTIRLQHLLYYGHLHWYDFYFYGLYMMHFVIPLLVAVLIWRLRPQQYWRYVWSLVTLSYAGFLTYLVFPAAPPWLAAQKSYIPHIEKLSTDVWLAFGVHNFPTLYEKFSPNEVAAVPSLHAAYPTLVMLFIWDLFGPKWGRLAIIYPLSVWIGVVYLGEHYLFDVLMGIIYASVSFFGVRLLWNRRVARRTAKRQLAAQPA